ncbi:hypothetical protein ACJX0J_016223 [Zea mays]
MSINHLVYPNKFSLRYVNACYALLGLKVGIQQIYMMNLALRSGLVVQEGEEVIPEKAHAITEAASDDDEDDGILSPSKPSHTEFGKSTARALVPFILIQNIYEFLKI